MFYHELYGHQRRSLRRTGLDLTVPALIGSAVRRVRDDGASSCGLQRRVRPGVLALTLVLACGVSSGQAQQVGTPPPAPPVQLQVAVPEPVPTGSLSRRMETEDELQAARVFAARMENLIKIETLRRQAQSLGIAVPATDSLSPALRRALDNSSAQPQATPAQNDDVMRAAIAAAVKVAVENATSGPAANSAADREARIMAAIAAGNAAATEAAAKADLAARTAAEASSKIRDGALMRPPGSFDQPQQQPSAPPQAPPQQQARPPAPKPPVDPQSQAETLPRWKVIGGVPHDMVATVIMPGNTIRRVHVGARLANGLTVSSISDSGVSVKDASGKMHRLPRESD